MEIELAAQMLALRAGSPARRLEAQIRAGAKAGLLRPEDAAVLTDAIALFWPLQAVSRLLGEPAADPAGLGAGARSFLLRETGAIDAADLLGRIDHCSARAHRVITQQLDPQKAHP
jgi:glutamate-ammonia-ligase adenylyltransferase